MVARDPNVASKVQNMSISFANVDQSSKEGIWDCSHIDQIDVSGDGRLKVCFLIGMLRPQD